MTSIVPVDGLTRGATQPDAAQVPAIVALRLSRTRFAVVWFGVIVVRVTCISFLLTMGWVYHVLISSPEMWYFASFLTPHYATLFRPNAWVHFAFGAAHMYELARTLMMSVREKSLLFGNHCAQSVSTDADKCGPRLPSLSAFKRVRSCYQNSQVLRFIFDRQGVFGAESPYFQKMFLTRELIEMSSQTVQIYFASILVGRPWINHLYVGTFVINACSTPVIERAVAHRSPALERVLCLASDVLLDSVMSIVLPALVMGRYLLMLDMTTKSFPATVVYSAVGFNRLVTESKQVLACHWIDLIVKLIPHLSIYACLNTIQSLTRPANVTLSMRIRQMQSQRLEQRKTVLVHAVFCLWGFVVLALHLAASYKAINDSTVPPGCLQSQWPWLTTEFACSVYKYNCSVHATTSPSEDSLVFLDTNSVAALVFADCPALTMPTTIRNFGNLMGIDVWNSTIADWGEDAALSSTHHPNMVYLVFFETNMTELPLGVLQDLPPQVGDIEISHSNLTVLPPDLDELWPQVQALYIEHCQLRVFPEAITRMRIIELSLVGNALTELPAMGSAAGHLYTLRLSGNPLKELPEDFGGDGVVPLLALDNTQITTLPSWITVDAASPSPSRKVFAYNTPFCASLTIDDREARYGGHAALTCANANPNIDGEYPVEIVKTQWQ